jgi:hypothetical protein
LSNRGGMLSFGTAKSDCAGCTRPAAWVRSIENSRFAE